MSNVLYLPYLPSVYWTAFFLKSENVCIEAYDNFQKSIPRNRTTIAAANGLQNLSIPLIGGRDTHRLYSETRISYSENWQKNHWRSLVSAYNRSPYFEHYAHYFEPYFVQKHEFLFQYNLMLLKTIMLALKSNSDINLTASYQQSFVLQDFVEKEYDALIPRYPQVFEDRNGFQQRVTVLDLIFNLGPQALAHLNRAEVGT